MRLSRGARPAHRGSVASAAQMRVVREMASYMELSLDRSLRRGELAERAGLSESALAEAFRAVTGRGPIDYLIDVRLAHAKRLLRTSRERIGAIAARVGIPDVYHFSKLFKKRAGCSPLEYRKRLRL
jgi:AraC-like DNA-binding protein